MAEVAIVWPGAISAVVLTLEAEDQALVHDVPWKRFEKVELRKVCRLPAEIEAAAGSVGLTPKAVMNAWSMAVLAAEGVDEK